MEQLLEQAKAVGLNEEQGKDTLGGMLGLLKSKLSEEDFAKVKGAVPGTEDLVSKAETAAGEQQGLPECLTGLLAQLKGLLAKVGITLPGTENAVEAREGGDESASSLPIDSTTQLLTLLGKSGITPQQVMEYAPKVIEFLQKNANVDTSAILKP